jgi:hypothetical protein
MQPVAILRIAPFPRFHPHRVDAPKTLRAARRLIIRACAAILSRPSLLAT